ncbi:uncharacterized protein [Ptychodera flava]|uniref:uncharacterized protein n=1 Tax=Ptychodera flava TaxID=63121 RepID=UPI00396AA333
MYLRIEIPPDDSPCHRFLWRDLEEDKAPDEYELTRVVFGENYSPFLAQFVTQAHVKAHINELPMAAETVLKSTYMDDSMDSVKTDSDGIILYGELSELWSTTGMHARKWLSNSADVLAMIPTKDRACEVDLDKDGLPSMKTLGVWWLAEEDVFTLKVNPPVENYTITKRSFLSRISTLSDPMGFLSPFTIQAKVLLQEIWAAGLEWDDDLDIDLMIKAQRWFS